MRCGLSELIGSSLCLSGVVVSSIERVWRERTDYRCSTAGAGCGASSDVGPVEPTEILEIDIVRLAEISNINVPAGHVAVLLRIRCDVGVPAPPQHSTGLVSHTQGEASRFRRCSIWQFLKPTLCRQSVQLGGVHQTQKGDAPALIPDETVGVVAFRDRRNVSVAVAVEPNGVENIAGAGR